ncbi:hypothetical protein Tco_0035164, partial [Tanacetum coccineum]
SVPRPILRIPIGTEDIGGLVVSEEATEEVVQQPEPELRKSKRNRSPKNFGPEFQLYLIEGTRDEKEAIYDEMDFIMGNNTWVLVDLPPVSTPMDTSEKLMPNNGKLSRYTSNPCTQHWQAIQRVTLMQAGSAILKTIRLQVAGYSCLVVVQFLGLPRKKLASLVQQ